MSRVSSRASDDFSYATGIGGNLYVWSKRKYTIENVCSLIGKSPASVYFNKKHKCWTIRIKSDAHRQAFDQIIKIRRQVPQPA